jgi:hypothetical protein
MNANKAMTDLFFISVYWHIRGHMHLMTAWSRACSRQKHAGMTALLQEIAGMADR